MNLEEYVARIITNMDPSLTQKERKDEIESIYEDFKNSKYTRGDIFKLINDALMNNLKKIADKKKNK